MDFLIGIGGVGMSALACALKAQGHAVAGADRTLDTPAVVRLEAAGIRVFPNDGSGITDAVTRVIVSTAIEADNPDLVAARARGIAITHRAAALADALRDYKLVAVAGTCGKSSVAAMLGHVLSACGFDPFVVNGAPIVGWNGAVRFGRGTYAVAEVDESDKSLTAFQPYAAIVTNASADHYSEAEMNAVFDAFVQDVPGPVIDARGEKYRPQDFMRQNASLVRRMALALGANAQAVERAMGTFPGVERRLECVGANVYDDYAHNPEKLRAMLAALQAQYAGGVLVIWRPHGYGPLRKMCAALGAMFRQQLRAQDRLVLLPVYDAGGTADRSIGSEALAAEVPGAEMVADAEAAKARARAVAGQFAACVTCGARDPGLPALARKIAETWEMTR